MKYCECVKKDMRKERKRERERKKRIRFGKKSTYEKTLVTALSAAARGKNKTATTAAAMNVKDIS